MCVVCVKGRVGGWGLGLGEEGGASFEAQRDSGSFLKLISDAPTMA